ncbi:MAG: polysaccharide deacetylase family protein [Acidobacteriaceae bacterium]
MLAYHEFGLHDFGDVYHLSPIEFKRHVIAVQSVTSSEIKITFDDGHLSQMRHAVPVLRDLGVMAMFFITTSWVGSRPEIMQWSHVRELCAQGHIIGTHGHTHTLLTSCSPSVLQEELQRSKEMAEDKLGVTVDTISMPGGRVNRDVLNACRILGYRSIYTSCPVRTYEFSGDDGRSTEMIGRLVVRRGMAASFIRDYVAGDKRTLFRLELEYRLKQGMKRGMGDRLYQALWSRVLRVKATPQTDLWVP